MAHRDAILVLLAPPERWPTLINRQFVRENRTYTLRHHTWAFKEGESKVADLTVGRLVCIVPTGDNVAGVHFTRLSRFHVNPNVDIFEGQAPAVHSADIANFVFDPLEDVPYPGGPQALKYEHLVSFDRLIPAPQQYSTMERTQEKKHRHSSDTRVLGLTIKQGLKDLIWCIQLFSFF